MQVCTHPGVPMRRVIEGVAAASFSFLMWLQYIFQLEMAQIIYHLFSPPNTNPISINFILDWRRSPCWLQLPVFHPPGESWWLLEMRKYKNELWKSQVIILPPLLSFCLSTVSVLMIKHGLFVYLCMGPETCVLQTENFNKK